MPTITKEIDFAGRKLTLEVGKFATQADGAVLASLGETIVLATAVSTKPREEVEYFPLRVDYEERLYAGGKIRGSRFRKREGPPSDEAIINGRLIDRSIRPLFPGDFTNEVQIIVTVLSVDQENDSSILSLLATSAALAISGIPWNGPVAGIRIGYKDGSFLLNPKDSEMEYSDLDLILTTKENGIIMIEGKGNEIPEEVINKAFSCALEATKPLFTLFEELKAQAGKPTLKYERKEIDAKVQAELTKFIKKNFPQQIFQATRQEQADFREKFLEKVYEKFEGKCTKAEMAEVFDEVTKEIVREKILKEELRPDGRKPHDIRPIEIEIGLLPRTHGSAHFRRGETQALTVATLGSTSLEQLIERMTDEETKRFIHHYNFPPFSTGETGRPGYPSRRETGHGALAEKALLPLIPSEEVFPYTIRLVSEILSSAGSTSMAAVCGSSLSLMDAGVPIKRPAAGIAIGLVKEGKKEVILTDIGPLEDSFGDMDFKIAGSEKGITALQMDTKLIGVSIATLKKVLEQAKVARDEILKKMLEVIGEPRKEISEYAPKITMVQIDPKKIGGIIGPGGKIIRSIQAATSTTIDIKDDGTVLISATAEGDAQRAKEWIEGIIKEIKVGEVFEGKVTRVVDFGAFVEILPGKEGLVHISEFKEGYIRDIQNLVKVGDKIKVKIIGIDEHGRINLSKKALLPQSVGAQRPRRTSFRPRGITGTRTTRRYDSPYYKKGGRGGY